MAWFHPKTLLDKTYEIGILIKGFDGVMEVLGAILLLLVKPHLDSLLHFLTQHELSHDPHDFIAQHILKYGHDLEKGSTVFAVLFLLTHGITKIVLVICLLRNKLWAYPFALGTLSLFVVYQIYRLLIEPTFGMIFLTVLDIIIIGLIWREWRQVRDTNHREATTG